MIQIILYFLLIMYLLEYIYQQNYCMICEMIIFDFKVYNLFYLEYKLDSCHVGMKLITFGKEIDTGIVNEFTSTRKLCL